MKILICLVSAALTFAVTLRAQTPGAAEQLADAVVRASGGEVWPRVKTLDFTFNVEENGKVTFSATHHWDVAAGTDAVSWGGKTAVADLKTGAATGAEAGDAQAAYKRWVNDSYWLLAPLKLRDPGTQLADKGERQIEGKTYRVLELSFQNVGLTPGDKYNFYIDPGTHLVARWDYMPAPGKMVSGTWEDYRDFSGLKLAISHRFGGKRIFFTGIKVTE